MNVSARRPCCVSPCPTVTTFLCLGRCERLCHSPRACTPSTPSPRETSPHQPPHSDHGPEPRGHFLHRWTSLRHTLARAWVRPHRYQANPFSSHQGRGVPGTNLVWHISPRLRFVPSSWRDDTTESRGSSVSWKVSLSREHVNTQNSAQPPVSPNPSQQTTTPLTSRCTLCHRQPRAVAFKLVCFRRDLPPQRGEAN